MVIRTVNASQTMILLRIPMLNQIKRQQLILMLQKVILKKRINYFFYVHCKFFREINVVMSCILQTFVYILESGGEGVEEIRDDEEEEDD